VHWDDDDWTAPHRLSAQVEDLRASGAQLCGLSTLIYFDPRSGDVWRYDYPVNGTTWVADATFAYRRELWERVALPDMSPGLDLAFLRSLPADTRVCRSTDHTFYVARLHAGNSTSKPTSSDRWRQADHADLTAVRTWLPHIGVPVSATPA
jgi:hypothetical protein